MEFQKLFQNGKNGGGRKIRGRNFTHMTKLGGQNRAEKSGKKRAAKIKNSE